MRSSAVVFRAPIRSGHDRDYGGEWYVGLSDTAICLGVNGERLACELAARWNAPLAKRIATISPAMLTKIIISHDDVAALKASTLWKDAMDLFLTGGPVEVVTIADCDETDDEKEQGNSPVRNDMRHAE